MARALRGNAHDAYESLAGLHRVVARMRGREKGTAYRMT